MMDLVLNATEQTDHNLALFRSKVQRYCKLAGTTQKALAHKLGYSTSFLSAKLHGSNHTVLTNADVKAIVVALAQWQAISYRKQAQDLLEVMNLSKNAFTSQEWNSPPLEGLETANSANPTLRVSPNQTKSSIIANFVQLVLEKDNCSSPKQPS